VAAGALVTVSAGVQATLSTAASAAPTSVVSGASVADSAARKSAVASCPSNMRVYGGGGDIAGGGHGVALTGLKPVSTMVNGRYADSFVATAEEADTGYAGNWTVYAWAICGPNLLNMTIQRGELAAPFGGDRQSASATCPSGTAPVGLGAEVINGNNNVVLNLVLGNYTTGPYGVKTGFSSATAFVDQSGYTGLWSIASYAVCATPPPGLTYKFADSGVDSIDKFATVECPAGTKVYGVGGYSSYYNGETHFDRMVPHGSQWTGADVEVREDQDGFAYNWFTEVEAICGQ
jgi:hypothetical protein